jgi:hypothetical protein
MRCFRGELTLGVHKIPFLEFSPGAEKLICIYNLCAFCATAMEHQREPFHSRMTDRIQLNLLRKYPSLQSKVPSSRVGFLELQFGCDFFSSKMNSNLMSRDAQFSIPSCYCITGRFAFNGKRSNGRTKSFNLGRGRAAHRPGCLGAGNTGEQ